MHKINGSYIAGESCCDSLGLHNKYDTENCIQSSINSLYIYIYIEARDKINCNVYLYPQIFIRYHIILGNGRCTFALGYHYIMLHAMCILCGDYQIHWRPCYFICRIIFHHAMSNRGLAE